MNWNQIEVNVNDSVPFKGNFPAIKSQEDVADDGIDTNCGIIGGFIKNGEWSWLAYERAILVISLRNRQTISRYEFCTTKGYAGYTIKNVEEVLMGKLILLAILLEQQHVKNDKKLTTNSLLVMYSIELSEALLCIKLNFKATCLKLLSKQICQRSYLKNFDRVIAIGSDAGDVMLLDIVSTRWHKTHVTKSSSGSFYQCNIYDATLTLTEIANNHKRCQKENIYFALKLLSAENSVNCILPIDVIVGLAVGHNSGRISFYNLVELHIFAIAEPPSWLQGAAVKKLNFMFLPNDRCTAINVWAMHEHIDGISAVMHSLIFEKRIKYANNFYYIEKFINCLISLELTLETATTTAVECEVIYKSKTQGENYMIYLCAFTWYSCIDQRTKLVLFDLHQWYKEQMPVSLNCTEEVSFLARFILNGSGCSLSTYLNVHTIAPFNSMRCIEKHFHLNALSFDMKTLLATDAYAYNWDGLQNKMIDMLRYGNATLFMRYEMLFNLIVNAQLLPQFSDKKSHSTVSRSEKYDVILSVALEHNCMKFLNSCVECLIDDNFMRQYVGHIIDLSLSTLTGWIWQRASDIKLRCNELGMDIFEYDSCTLDRQKQQEFAYITHQMRLLSELLSKILINGMQKISKNIYNNLHDTHKSLCDAVGYQEILSGLFKFDLLPEGSYNADATLRNEILKYPLVELKSIYKNRRASYAKLSEQFVSKKTGYCRLLYIDAFIERIFPPNKLHHHWFSNDNDDLYPPTTFKKLLNVFLIPHVNFEHKCAVLLYFFMDAVKIFNSEYHKNLLETFMKCSDTIKLSTSLFKTIQAFWYLNNKEFLPAIQEFTSQNKKQSTEQWEVELFIESLLLENQESLALIVLESAGSVNLKLHIKTLIANKHIAEALEFVRSTHNKELLELYFKCCLKSANFNAVCQLALTNYESCIFQEILKNVKDENLLLIFLLKKSHYLEAFSNLDERTKLNKGTRINDAFSQRIKVMRTQGISTSMPDQTTTANIIMSAYNSVTISRRLTDAYFLTKHNMKQEIDASSPVPFSCQLIRENANDLIGGIYQSAALSTLLTTSDNSKLMANGEKCLLSSESMMNSSNAPFLHKMEALLDRKSIESKLYQGEKKHTFIEDAIYENKTNDIHQNADQLSRLDIIDEKDEFRKIDLRAPIGRTAAPLESTAAASTNATNKKRSIKKNRKDLNIKLRPTVINEASSLTDCEANNNTKDDKYTFQEPQSIDTIASDIRDISTMPASESPVFRPPKTLSEYLDSDAHANVTAGISSSAIRSLCVSSMQQADELKMHIESAETALNTPTRRYNLRASSYSASPARATKRKFTNLLDSPMTRSRAFQNFIENDALTSTPNKRIRREKKNFFSEKRSYNNNGQMRKKLTDIMEHNNDQETDEYSAPNRRTAKNNMKTSHQNSSESESVASSSSKSSSRKSNGSKRSHKSSDKMDKQKTIASNANQKSAKTNKRSEERKANKQQDGREEDQEDDDKPSTSHNCTNLTRRQNR